MIYDVTSFPYSTLVHRQLNHCTVYTVISERLTGRTRNVTLCGTITRERNVYVSMTNSIDVALMHHTQIIENDIQEDEEDSPAFLLKYRGGSLVPKWVRNVNLQLIVPRWANKHINFPEWVKEFKRLIYRSGSKTFICAEMG